MDKVRIKLFLGEDVRLVTLPNKPSSSELLRIIYEKFERVARLDKYEDNEGDKITIDDDQDLEEAFRNYFSLQEARPQLLHTLTLYLKEEPQKNLFTPPRQIIAAPAPEFRTNPIAFSSDTWRVDSLSTEDQDPNYLLDYHTPGSGSNSLISNPISFEGTSPNSMPPVSFEDFLIGKDTRHNPGRESPFLPYELPNTLPSSTTSTISDDYTDSHYNGVVPSSEISRVENSPVQQRRLKPVPENVKWKIGKPIADSPHVSLGLLETGELVVVKRIDFDEILPNQGQSLEVRLQKFKQEIAVMQKLEHEHIVQFLGYQITDNILNVFLEYVPGGSLRQVISRFGTLSEGLARVYTRQILLGLEYLHENHTIHRDIKAANILVDITGKIKLADFGCSKICQTELPEATSLQGSPFWMAPEVILGVGYSYTADIWSLGCTVLEMLTGGPPFCKLDMTTVLYTIANGVEDPPFPQNISAEASDFLHCCFIRDSKVRPDATTLLTHPFVSNKEDHISEPISLSGPESVLANNQIEISIQILPEEILCKIFSWVRASDISAIGLVCKSWNQISAFPVLWKSICEHEWKCQIFFELPGLDWKKIYFRHLHGIGLFTRDLPWKSVKVHKKPIRTLEVWENTIYSSGDDKRIKVVNLLPRPRKGRSFAGHTGCVHRVIVSEGKLFSVSSDQTIRIWDLTGQSKRVQIGSFRDETPIINCVVRSNGQLVSLACDGAIKLWNPTTTKSDQPPEILFAGNGQTSTTASCLGYFDLDCPTLVSSVGSVVKFWNLDSLECFVSLHADSLITCLSVNSFFKVVFSASDSGKVCCWNGFTSGLLFEFVADHSGVCCMESNEDFIVTGGNSGMIQVWDVFTLCKIIEIQAFPTPVIDLKISDEWLVAASGKLIKVWSFCGDIFRKRGSFV